jgi:hypothetical protein
LSKGPSDIQAFGDRPVVDVLLEDMEVSVELSVWSRIFDFVLNAFEDN